MGAAWWAAGAAATCADRRWVRGGKDREGDTAMSERTKAILGPIVRKNSEFAGKFYI